jgi:hypothetical protein
VPTGFWFDAPLPLLIGAIMAIAAGIIGWRAPLPRSARWAFSLALLLAIAAAGAPRLERRVLPRLAVLVDVSPSTRTGAWREPAWLEAFIQSLAAKAEPSLYAFAAEPVPVALEDYTGAEQQAPTTRMALPDGYDAYLILTDGRLELIDHGATATLAIDEALLAPSDAAVTGLRIDGDRILTTAQWRGQGGPTLSLEAGGVRQAWRESVLLHLPVDADRPTVARVVEGDPWPENNQLRLGHATFEYGRRLWFGGGAAGTFEPLAVLPPSADALAGASILVLANIPAGDVSPAAQRALRDYVMNLGGTLVLLGGDRAFAAGGYAGTLLEALSPLSSLPPAPQARWVLLADASGSMAQPAGTQTRFERAAAALSSVLPALPPESEVEIGGFAAGMTWWSRGGTAEAASRQHYPPPGATSGGPTNLAAVLRSLAGEGQAGDLPTQVIAITDAEVPLNDAAGLAEALRGAGIILNVVNVGGGAEGAALAELVEATGGRFVSAADPIDWGEAARRVAQAAIGEPVTTGRASVRFTGPLEAVGGLTLEQWNLTWPKQETTMLAVADAVPGTLPPAAATWQVGLGRVVALGFETPTEAAVAIADAFESAADGSGALVEWHDGTDLVIRIHAPDGTSAVAVRRGGADVPAQRVAAQTWEVRIAPPREPEVTSVVVDGRVTERRATAGRYSVEFDLERLSLEDLRARFDPAGHDVISLSGLPDWHPPARNRVADLTTAAALAAFAAGATGLLLWRRGGLSPEAR